MSTRGSLPPASIHGTWSENAEIWDIDTDTYMDLTSVTEITLRLVSEIASTQLGNFSELLITMTNGDITIPAPGIIQWRVERDTMGTLRPTLYEVILTFEDIESVEVVLLGTISVLG